MQSDNFNSKVFSECVTTHAPGPNGARMLHFIAGGGKGGVIQFMASPPPKVMFSAWVFVTKGFVQIQPHGGAGGPVAHSGKLGEGTSSSTRIRRVASSTSIGSRSRRCPRAGSR
jgi:hypothetical protein